MPSRFLYGTSSWSEKSWAGPLPEPLDPACLRIMLTSLLGTLICFNPHQSVTFIRARSQPHLFLHPSMELVQSRTRLRILGSVFRKVPI